MADLLIVISIAAIDESKKMIDIVPLAEFLLYSISDKFCESISSLIGKTNSEVYSKIRNIVTNFIKGKISFKNIQYYDVAKEIEDEFNAGYEPIGELIKVITLFFEERQDPYDRIASTVIPVVVYICDENNLPEIFDRINSQGTHH